MKAAILATLLIPGAALWASATNPWRPATDVQALDTRAEPLRSTFNADRGKVRLVLYVAPTCGGCLRQADEIQKEVLSAIEDPDLAIYVVWAPRNGAQEGHVERVAGLMKDRRASQYWDGHGAVADPVDAMLGLSGPCAGIAMLYGRDASWDAEPPPAPAYWEDAHDFEFHRAAEQFDPKRFAGRLREMLERTT